MIVSLTGTRYGMSEGQMASFRTLFDTLKVVTQFHHGSCQGADVQAAQYIGERYPGVMIVAHPGPDDDPWREEAPAQKTMPGKNHFARNRDLVDVCDVLIVVPKDMESITDEKAKGGTAMSYRYGLKQKKRIIVIAPNGDVNDIPKETP